MDSDPLSDLASAIRKVKAAQAAASRLLCPTGTDAELLAHMGTRPLLWAEEWCMIAQHLDDPVDIGFMIGWFANAIEAGRLAGAAENADLRRQLEDARDLVVRSGYFQNLLDEVVDG